MHRCFALRRPATRIRAAGACPDARLRLDAGLPLDVGRPDLGAARHAIPPLVAAWLH